MKTMQYHAKPCHTMQYHAISCNTMQYHAIQCNTMQYHAIPCNTMQYHAIPCNTMQYHATPCNTMQYHAIPCNTMQYHGISCNTMQYHESLITADGAYHCPVGSIMAIFIMSTILHGVHYCHQHHHNHHCYYHHRRIISQSLLHPFCPRAYFAFSIGQPFPSRANWWESIISAFYRGMVWNSVTSTMARYRHLKFVSFFRNCFLSSYSRLYFDVFLQWFCTCNSYTFSLIFWVYRLLLSLYFTLSPHLTGWSLEQLSGEAWNIICFL